MLISIVSFFFFFLLLFFFFLNAQNLKDTQKNTSWKVSSLVCQFVKASPFLFFVLGVELRNGAHPTMNDEPRKKGGLSNNIPLFDCMDYHKLLNQFAVDWLFSIVYIVSNAAIDVFEHTYFTLESIHIKDKFLVVQFVGRKAYVFLIGNCQIALRRIYPTFWSLPTREGNSGISL